MSQYYLAPLEGITGYVYRNAYHKYFTPMDKYFTPFIETHTKRSFNTRELNDILPEHNEGMYVVPQLLTNNAEDFIRTAKDLATMGYQEINLNLGCPSGTVTARKKGAGFLSVPKELDVFLEKILEQIPMDISIKTRIGVSNPEEFDELLAIYNKYSLKELIIHPRIREDFYRNKPNMEVFGKALDNSKNQVCYNGDVFTWENAASITAKYPKLPAIMLGRGVIANPMLPEQIMQQSDSDDESKQRVRAFHDKILTDYCRVISGDKNVLFKMKELWTYLGCIFTEPDSYCKKIRKAEKIREYELIVDSLFREQEIRKGAGFHL
ncbi:MAG: tRNA-dihydrouridine synthase family protein [Lachnospiraceae bacterium]|nr:tRNA-dihydrouridine synthase family protein [Lachnospiraceae bacterium]